MNTQLTEIAFILDRSGSMQSLAGAAMDGFNEFLEAQQSAPGQARLTLVLFDDEYLVPAASLPVAEIIPLDADSYTPRGCTALCDAIGRTVEELGARLAAMAPQERPGTVLVVILTDGLENASTRFSWQQVARRIRHQREKYGWEFLFLGANQDAIATAAQLQIAATNAASYVADDTGHRSGSAALSRKAKGLRSRALGCASPTEMRDAAAPLEEIVQEEDRSRRGEA